VDVAVTCDNLPAWVQCNKYTNQASSASVEVYMSEIQNEREQEVSAEVEAEDGLVEAGKVSETKGGFFGVALDVGGGYRIN
jgi:hypothetical protein